MLAKTRQVTHNQLLQSFLADVGGLYTSLSLLLRTRFDLADSSKFAVDNTHECCRSLARLMLRLCVSLVPPHSMIIDTSHCSM
jgi:hypothetical protein